MPETSSRPARLEDYISGGYYLARFLEPGTERAPSPLLPKRYISASHCLCEFFPGPWVWDYAGPTDSAGNLTEGISRFEERLVSASRFGITAEQLPEVVRWGQLGCGRDFGIPSGFYRLIDARRGIDWIGLPPERFAIFGIGLHRSLAPKFLQDTAKDSGVLAPECVRQEQELDRGGTPLGHELLNTEFGHPGCSWICNGLEHWFAERKQIVVNRFGYVESFESARACSVAINSGEVGAEPGPWFPWLIIEYT